MKQTIYSIIFFITMFFAFSACSNAYPDIVNTPSVKNLNYSSGSYVTWDALDNATAYNIYMVSSDNTVSKLKSTKETFAFVENGSTWLAISADVNGKESYLSELQKGNNTWWTEVTCKNVDTGYSLSWDAVPVAEDYVLISQYEITYVMNEYITARSELKTDNLENYDHKATSSNSYNAVYSYRKCKSLNTTENNVIYTENDFIGSYSNYICLYAKIGNAYYQISDRFGIK